jgi:ABC-type polysaccharide/polyol phosphate transport system ATPase subunit
MKNDTLLNQQIAIQLLNITKKYVIHHEKPTLVEKFYKGKEEKFLALNDISLTIKKGERVGIIGPNGSGKTTLLKIIARVTSPTYGKIITNGKTVSLIDLSAGFHPDLTGYHNIYLNGMILGLTKQEINSKMNDIIEFADIRQFIDAPLFTYSSGMILRLGFAIAVHTNPDILILDEGLNVGDKYFQKKTFLKIKTFVQQKKTLLTVTHDMGFIKKYCDRVILLNKGKINRDGQTSITSYYEKSF